MKGFGCVVLAVFAILLSVFVSCNLEDPAEDPSVQDYSYSLQLVDGKVISPDCDYVVCVEKKHDEDFVILNFADVQMLVTENHFPFLEQSVNALVSETKPSLITLTGDQTYGYDSELNEVCRIMEGCGLPWAPVFGNHDCNQLQLSLEEQASVYGKSENCLFRRGPVGLGVVNGKNDAIGNYVVNIVEIDGSSFRVVRSLVFMNTRDCDSYGGRTGLRYDNGYSWSSITEEQKKWFVDMVQSVQRYGADGKVGCGIVLHIPPFGYLEAAQAAFNIDADIFNVSSWMEKTSAISYEASFNPDLWKEGYKDSFGVMHEPMGCPPYDDGFFEVVKGTGVTDFIIAGYEHINNFCIDYQGVSLIYAMKTGKGAYHDESMMGGTVITVKGDGSCTFEHRLYLDGE